MKATPTGGTRWQVIDGLDLVTVWIDSTGFHSQRVSNFKGSKPLGHEVTTLEYDDLIPAAEGQRKLL